MSPKIRKSNSSQTRTALGIGRTFWFAWPIFLGLLACNTKVVEDERLLERLLEKEKAHYGLILENPEVFEVQIIYTQVNRDSENVPSFRSFYYNVDPDRYFYPASTVKMPTAFLALEKLQKLGIAGLDKHTTMLTDSAYSGQQPVRADSSAANGLPSIAHYIKKIFLVSDNDAYNRLYEFLGQEAINTQLAEKGYEKTRILHRLSVPLSAEENAYTNPIRFVADDTAIYTQPLTKSAWHYAPKNRIMKGEAHMKNDSLIASPFDFTFKNFMPLTEMQQMLRSVVFPQPNEGFQLAEEDRAFVLQCLFQLPTESRFPAYDSAEINGAYCKFLMYGGEGTVPPHIRIFNKIGQAYGYLTDNAYIVDFEQNIEFFLSAVIHTNANKTYNDGVYEYDSLAFPFMKHLGETIYRHELQRDRAHVPDLSSLRMNDE